tara:strand:- start:17 stop:523 length:507 start_codon:yes stop_codon:yes gene_type:complete
MSLLQINKTVADGSSTAISVTGINSADVYAVYYHSLQTQNNNETLSLRITKSSTADTTNNYSQGRWHVSSIQDCEGVGFNNFGAFRLADNVHNGDGGSQGIITCFDFNSSSEFSYLTTNSVEIVSNQSMGNNSGGVHKVASASDGISIYGNSGGTFVSGGSLVLYKVI